MIARSLLSIWLANLIIVSELIRISSAESSEQNMQSFSSSSSTFSSSSSTGSSHSGSGGHFSQSSRTSEDDESWYLYLQIEGYKPDELNIHLMGRSLTVSGKHEQDEHVLNQFQQNFMVPQGVFMDTVESTWDPKDNEIMISGSKVENKKAELPRKIEIKVKQDNVEL